MTKQQVEQKIKEILSKDNNFRNAKITITFKEKLQEPPQAKTTLSRYKRVKAVYTALKQHYEDIK